MKCHRIVILIIVYLYRLTRKYRLLTLSSLKDLKILNGSAILVDAILGSGAKGELKDPLLSIITEVNKIKAYKVAIDIPTGLDADSGLWK